MKNKIVERIKRWGPGRAFMAKDFRDIASRGTVDMALSSLVGQGTIRRIRRGLYDLPRVNPSLGGALSPDLDETARALSRRYRWKTVPEGAWAANLLGLSTQVPAKIVYLSDGPNKKVRIGRQAIHFKHARPQVLTGYEGVPALVVQALRHLGRDEVDRDVVVRLRKFLSEAERRKLVKATRFGVDWIYDTAKKIAGESA